MRTNMKRTFGLSIALCLGFVWGCAEVEVLIPPHLSSGLKHQGPDDDPGSTPISLKELKQIQANKKPMCNRNGSMMLDVRHERQRTPFWCWAETSRMVMEYQNELAGSSTKTQCEIVTDSLGRKLGKANCCETQSSTDFIPPRNCLRGEWPSVVFERYGFNYMTVAEALDEESLINEICGNGPFLYVVNLQGGGKHALVAEGYDASIEEKPIVRIYDPTQDDYEDQAYDEFAGVAPDARIHYRDYVQISPKAKDKS